MALIATNSWCWFLDREHNLSIELGDQLCFRTPYQRNSLTPRMIRKQRMLWELDEASFYHTLCDSLHQHQPGWSDAEVTQAALNATAAQFLLRMPANRSWLFAENKRSNAAVWNTGDLAHLKTSSGVSLIVVLAREGHAASCLLLESLDLAECGKPLPRFSPQRINCDRFFSVPTKKPLSYRAAG